MTMDITAGPAALSGLILSVAICAWALGRLQGGMMGDNRRGGAPLSRPQTSMAGHQRDLAEAGSRALQSPLAADPRPNLFDDATSLGELHQHVAAIRRRERVLAPLSAHPVGAESSLAGPGRDTFSQTGQAARRQSCNRALPARDQSGRGSWPAARPDATTEQCPPRPRAMPLAAPRYPLPDWSVWTRV